MSKSARRLARELCGIRLKTADAVVVRMTQLSAVAPSGAIYPAMVSTIMRNRKRRAQGGNLQLGKLSMGSAVKVLVPHALKLQVLFVAEENSLVPIFRLEREFELFSALATGTRTPDTVPKSIAKT